MATRTLLTLLISLSLYKSLVVCATQTHPVYHRYLPYTSYPKTALNPEWKLRGSIHLDTETDKAWFDDQSSSSGQELSAIRELEYPALELQSGRYEKILYQIAVGDGQRNFIGVDSCILSHHPKMKFNETLTIHVIKESISGLAYTTNSIRQGCVEKRSGLVRGSERNKTDLEIVVMEPVKADEPIFNKPDVTKPVVVDEEGKIVPPPPEKGFLAKYWIYILPVVVVLMMGGDDSSSNAATTAAK